MQIVNILKKIWPYAIMAIVCAVFWQDIYSIGKEIFGLIALALGFLFWSKRTKLDTKPAKAEAAESKIQSDIRLKDAVSELDQAANKQSEAVQIAKESKPPEYTNVPEGFKPRNSRSR
jgi:hypothetical protein